MSELLARIEDLSWGRRVAFSALSFVIIGGVFWQYVYSELSTQVGELEEKKISLNSRIATERRLAKNLGIYRQEVKDLEVRLTQALQELPDKKEIPDLLSSISSLARDAGLDVSLFRPVPEVIRDFYSEVPVAISVEGTYHQVATFFDEVGRLSRIVNINDISVRDPQSMPDQLRVKTDCTATTFRYLDEAERARAAEPEDNQRRRR